MDAHSNRSADEPSHIHIARPSQVRALAQEPVLEAPRQSGTGEMVPTCCIQALDEA